jgi:hypothetical protein
MQSGHNKGSFDRFANRSWQEETGALFFEFSLWYRTYVPYIFVMAVLSNQLSELCFYFIYVYVDVSKINTQRGFFCIGHFDTISIVWPIGLA